MISITFYLGIFSVIASVAQLGIFYWDKTYYAQIYRNLDVDLGWIMLGVAIVFLSLSRIMEQLEEIKNKVGGENVTSLKKNFGKLATVYLRYEKKTPCEN